MNRSSSHTLPKSIMKTNNTTHNAKQTVSYSDRRCSQDAIQSRSSYSGGGVSGSGRKRRSVQFHSACQLIPIKDTEFELEEPQLSEILYVKHCYKTYGTRASNRSWTSCLVVCERGHLKLFKARSKDTQYTVDVANLNNQLGTLSLQHSLARPLPQEHYSTKRPYLIQLDLPNGSMYMIQLTSATNIGNWVGVLNYWAARETTPPTKFPSFQLENKRGKLSTKLSTSSLFMKFLSNTNSTQCSGSNSDWSPPLPPLTRSTLNIREQLDLLIQYHQLIYAKLKDYQQPQSPKHQQNNNNNELSYHLNYLSFELNRFEIYIKTLVDFLQFQVNYSSKQIYDYSSSKWLDNSPSSGGGGAESIGYSKSLSHGTPYSIQASPLPLNYLDSVTCLQTLQRPESVASSTTLNQQNLQSNSSQLISLHYYPSPSNRTIEKHRKSWSLSQKLSPLNKLKSLNLIKPQH